MDRKVRRTALIVGLLATAGCAMNGDEMAARWIAEMDAAPPEERVPRWELVRARMLRRPPAKGEAAPDFELALRDDSGSVRLSEFRGERPVVLIFGSWT